MILLFIVMEYHANVLHFFEEDKYGTIRISPSHIAFVDMLEEINKAEYENALKLIMNKLTNMMR